MGDGGGGCCAASAATLRRGLSGPYLGPTGQLARHASPPASRLLQPEPLKVIPSQLRYCWSLSIVALSQSGQPRYVCCVGASGREKSLSDLADTDAVTPAGAAILPKGRWVYLSLTPLRVPEEILGFVPAVASSSSQFFLKVLLCSWQSNDIEGGEILR
ncbi:hypothetical protein D1007_41495 [Hordeum vulgare]|nr:hypothetical protein D1007_41495 [Hordeum vulgare]